MPDPVAAVSAGGAGMAPDAIDPDRVLEGAPTATVHVLATTPTGDESGVWRCTPGRFRDVEASETFVVIDGRATIEWDGGSVDVGPGDVCCLAEGTETVWTVHETLLKGFSTRGSGG